MKGFKDIPARFFMWENMTDEDGGDFIECGEEDFINAEGVIEYERHTVFLNGCDQIRLTKDPL